MTDHLPHIPLRRASALAVVAAALALPAAAHAAKAPTVEIGVGADSIAVAGAGDLGRGAVRLHVSGAGLSERRSVAVIELKPGKTPADVEAADLAGLDDAAQAERLGRLVAGGEVSSGRDYATTIEARARKYVVVDVSVEDGAAAAYEVGRHAGGARPPAADASIRLQDDAVDVPRALPRDGVVKIANRGRIAHELTAFRIKRGVSETRAIRILRHGGRLDRIGSTTVLTGLVSSGAVNRVEAHLRSGRYLLASFYNPLTAGGRPDVLRGLVAVARVR